MILERVQEVIRDRKVRMRMNEASYWDDRARSRTGFARSVWHAASFSQAWAARQERLLDKTFDDLLGSLSGREVLEVGCGTGRITRYLASRGANAVGVDFAPVAIDYARKESEGIPGLRYEVGNVLAPPLAFEPRSFDSLIAVGCLAVACKEIDSLQTALAEMKRLVRPDGLIVLLEPIHTSWLLGRVLKAPVQDWVQAAERAGLRLVRHHGMGFVPVRLAMSSFDLPSWVVAPTFTAGELALDSSRLALRLADYSLLCFRPVVDEV